MTRRAGAFAELAIALWLALGVSAACGDPPVPVERAAPAAPAALPPGHPNVSAPAAALPADGVLVTGRVRLRGALAERDDGVLWISLRPRGGGMPLRFRAFAMTSADISDPAGGERVLEFDVRDSDLMMAAMPKPPLPAEIELRAIYDADGIVDSKEDQVAAQAPVRAGDRGVELVLEPRAK